MRAVLNTQVRVAQWGFNVKVYSLIRDDEESLLHWTHRPCTSRLREQMVCPTCQVVPPPEEMVRGAQTPQGVVFIEEDDLARITPPRDKTLDVEFFTPMGQVTPELVAGHYGLVPADDPSRRGYHLLVETLRAQGVVGITRITPRTRTKMAALGVVGRQLRLWSLHYAECIQTLPDPAPAPPRKEELLLSRRLTQSMTRLFNHRDYLDATVHRLQGLIESKRAGTPTRVPLVQLAAPLPQETLLAALRASLPAKKKVKRR